MRRNKSPIANLLSAVCNRRRREAAQALVEYAIVFPLQLLITLTIIQLAQIFVAKQVLEYAAFCGARAELTGYNPQTNLMEQDVNVQTAMIIPLSAITGPTVPGGQPSTYMWWVNPQNPTTGVQIPGWYNGTFLPGSDVARLKLRPNPDGTPWARPGTDPDTGEPIVQCDIEEYDYELSVPMGNFMVSELGSLFMNPNVFDWTTYGTPPVPHLKMQAHCRLAQPWAQTQ